ncbi:MAG: TIGR04282 family arsenosugar biosynthesis glycosyltransferase [Sphingomonas sp.]|nr:TIGR04282 family arsenosugar biosynthesis glycosyltransferase [Sphingomonas sp.]
MSGVRIIIFAKAPVPGSVKTRLVPALGQQAAAELARSMLKETILEATAAGVGPTEICGDPEPADPSWGSLLETDALELSAQGEGGLGERLARAAQRALGDGSPAVLIGSDCPSLNRHRLRDIAAQLEDHDAVIQPAMDGGYVALGLRKFHPSLFHGIAWSTEAVANDTVRRIIQLGWTYFIAEPLRDIDTPEDLKAEGLTA